MLKNCIIICVFFLSFLCEVCISVAEGAVKDVGIQLADNPAMQFVARTPPASVSVSGDFEVRKGFTLIESLDEFRAAIKRDRQKIRMKPGGVSCGKAGSSDKSFSASCRA